MIFFPSLCLSLAETKAGEKPGLGGGKVLNIIVRNFSFQCIKFKLCQASTESPERILSSGPAYGIVIGVQRWIKLWKTSAKHSFQGLRSIVSLLCQSSLEKTKF